MYKVQHLAKMHQAPLTAFIRSSKASSDLLTLMLVMSVDWLSSAFLARAKLVGKKRICSQPASQHGLAPGLLSKSLRST